MLENTIKITVGSLVEQVKEKCFMPNAQPTNRAAFGSIMSKFFEWSGICIAEAAVEALRDANFRSLADNIECLIEYELSESGKTKWGPYEGLVVYDYRTGKLFKKQGTMLVEVTIGEKQTGE